MEKAAGRGRRDRSLLEGVGEAEAAAADGDFAAAAEHLDGAIKVGLGRIVALYYRSSTLYHIRCLYF